MAPSAPTELSQQSIQQIVAGLQQAQGATGLPREIYQKIIIILLKTNKFSQIIFRKPENTNYIENDQEFETLIEQSKNKKSGTR